MAFDERSSSVCRCMLGTRIPALQLPTELTPDRLPWCSLPPRQGALESLGAGDDGAGRGPGDAGLRLAVEADAAADAVRS